MLIWLNKFLFLPPLAALAVNAIYFAAVFLLVGSGLFSKTINDLLSTILWTDASLEKTLIILFIVSAAIAAVVYGRTKAFFICARQGLQASLGTTLVVIVIYASLWALYQITMKTQTLVLYHPHLWSLQGTLNNLKNGSIIFLFASVLSIAGSSVIPSDGGYKYTTFLDLWKRWKTPVEKLAKNSKLDISEHESLKDATEKMLTEVKNKSGYSQPISSRSLAELAAPLTRFQSWYALKTEASYLACDGLEPVIQDDVKAIMRLC